jgi:hypothetical protein
VNDKDVSLLVLRFALFFPRSPDRLGVPQIERYLFHLRDNPRVSYCLFNPAHRDPNHQVGALHHYEREDRQREVIDSIERNPHVVAALVPAFPQYGSVDSVPNATRAPLVWKYIQDHFRPDYQAGNVVFWRRK